MSTARIPDRDAPGLVQVGLPSSGHQSMPGRSDPPVKPTSEVAHQPGQQPAAAMPCPHVLKYWSGHVRIDMPCQLDRWHDGQHVYRGDQGPAVECSTERSRAPDRQPVAPVEGRAWETPATRTV